MLQIQYEKMLTYIGVNYECSTVYIHQHITKIKFLFEKRLINCITCLMDETIQEKTEYQAKNMISVGGKENEK